MAIDTQDKEFRLHLDLYAQVRACIAGKWAVMDLLDCLPSPAYKSYADINTPSSLQCQILNTERVRAYWNRGRFYNATGVTSEALSGMLWSVDPEVSIPKSMGYLESNADGSGGSIRDVVQECSDDLVAIGRFGMLVDMPSSGVGPTQSEMESGENSPRIIGYKAEQIIYFRVSGSSKSVDEVRLIEVKSERVSEFDWKDVVYIRRLVMIDGVYHNQLYKDGEIQVAYEFINSLGMSEQVFDVIPIADGKPLTEIPFQFFGSDDNSPNYSKPPLYDLAHTNLGHFVLDCDNRDNLHYHGQGMTNVFSEMSPTEFNEANPNGLDSGAKGKNMFLKDDRVEILQLEATGAIPAEMVRDEQRMVALGAQTVQDVNSNATLGAKEMEFSTSVSTLHRIGRNISVGMVSVLDWVATFAGVSDDEISYTMNDSFVIDELSPEMINAQLGLVQASILPPSSMYEPARRAKMTSLDDDELASELSESELSMNGSESDTATMQAEIDSLIEQLEAANAK